MNLREVTYLAWLKTLADTYDVYAKLAGVIQNDQPVLLPLAHSTFNAQIEVTIDENGNFIDSCCYCIIQYFYQNKEEEKI